MVLLPCPDVVSGVNDNVPFEPVIAVVGVIAVAVVESPVDAAGPVILVSTAVVSVFPVVSVIGEVADNNTDDEAAVLTSVLFATPVLIPELGDPGVSVLVNVLEFVTGYGAGLDGCTDTAGDVPLALVRLTPGESSDAGAVPEDAGNGVDVTIPVVGNPPLGTVVVLTRLEVLDAGNGGVLDSDPVELGPALVSSPDGRDADAVPVSEPGVV